MSQDTYGLSCLLFEEYESKKDVVVLETQLPWLNLQPAATNASKRDSAQTLPLFWNDVI